MGQGGSSSTSASGLGAGAGAYGVSLGVYAEALPTLTWSSSRSSTQFFSDITVEGGRRPTEAPAERNLARLVMTDKVRSVSS
jgi:hypothetical protein